MTKIEDSRIDNFVSSLNTIRKELNLKEIKQFQIFKTDKGYNVSYKLKHFDNVMSLDNFIDSCLDLINPNVQFKTFVHYNDIKREEKISDEFINKLENYFPDWKRSIPFPKFKELRETLNYQHLHINKDLKLPLLDKSIVLVFNDADKKWDCWNVETIKVMSLKRVSDPLDLNKELESNSL